MAERVGSGLGSWALAAPNPDPGPAIFRLDFPRKGSVASGAIHERHRPENQNYRYLFLLIGGSYGL